VIANVEKLREALDKEKEPEVRWKLSFINLVTGGMKLKDAAACFGIGIATSYKWIRRWNNEGVEGLKRRKIPGRPPKLSVEELEELRRILKAKPYWSVKEVMRLVKELFGVNYSDEQIRRILVEKLGMNYAKPFVRDYRRPKDAEDILAERVEGAVKNLRDTGYKDDDIVIGFLDEASPQNQANTVRVLSFGKPRIFKKYGQDES
jgi:putative transposase